MTLSPWLAALDHAARQLRAGQISGRQWQAEIDRLFGAAPMASILAHPDIVELMDRMREPRSTQRGDLFIELPEAGGLVGPTGTARFKLAHVLRGRSIAPHGHDNMVSAFLCVSGEFRVRSYERVRAGIDAWEVRQAFEDERAARGTWSSVSDERHNVHWLEAHTEDAFLLTTKLTRLDPERPHVSRVYLDLAHAEPGPDGVLRAPVIEKRDAGLRY